MNSTPKKIYKSNHEIQVGTQIVDILFILVSFCNLLVYIYKNNVKHYRKIRNQK